MRTKQLLVCLLIDAQPNVTDHSFLLWLSPSQSENLRVRDDDDDGRRGRRRHANAHVHDDSIWAFVVHLPSANI